MPGIYVHIPFCLHKCNYCNFYSVCAQPAERERYLVALEREIEWQSEVPAWKSLEYHTLYFGGGTPSLLTVEQLEQLLRKIRVTFEFTIDPEITLEVNPETVDLAKLIAIKQIGFNRLNVGIQSWRDPELKLLERIHTAERARTIIHNAHTVGFENLGLDLIFAIPGQKYRNWQQNLAEAVIMAPTHISTYGLTIEAGTALAQMVAAGQLKKSHEKLEREMYAETMRFLTAQGFEHYEISNFARPGFRSQHNQIYWRNESYLGLGASAHSYVPFKRSWNVADWNEYVIRLSQNQSPCAGTEILTPEQQMIECIMLGLRRKEGINLRNFQEKFHADFLEIFQPVLRKLDLDPVHENQAGAENFLKLNRRHLALTSEGFLLYDEICAQFVAGIDDAAFPDAVFDEPEL